MQACPRCLAAIDGRFCPFDGCPLVESLVGELVLGDLRLTSVLGRGATGEVFEAVQEPLGRAVAVKVLHANLAADARMQRRFLREARAIATLDHPGIVRILEVGATASGRAAMAMERLTGPSLETTLQTRGRLPEAEVVAIARQLAAALEVIHQAGVVHRDLKPANLLWDRRGGSAQLKIVDFGIARWLSDDPNVTSRGDVLGTPHYMAPEQAACEQVDGRADLYALGVVLYQLATGQLPFDGDRVIDVLMSHLHEPPPSPRLANPALSRELEAIVLRCLAKDPAARFASAAELAAALPPLAPPEPITVQVPLPARRRRSGRWALLPLAMAAAAVLAPFHSQPAVASANLAHRWIELTAGPDEQAVIVAGHGIAMRAVYPAAISARRPVELELRLWDDDGTPIRDAEPVVMIAGPKTAPRAAAASDLGDGRYQVRTRFARAGDHVVYVYLLANDATLTLPIAVASAT